VTDTVHTHDQRVFDARIEYISAAVGEVTMVANAAEALNEEDREARSKLAQLAGDNAQQKFELFIEACTARQAEHDLNAEVANVVADE